MSHHLIRVTPWLLVACLAGCGKNVIKPVSEDRTTSLPRPTHVLVYDLAVSEADVTLNRSIILRTVHSGSKQEQREEIGEQAANSFASKLVEGINQLGLEAERAERDAPVPENALLVTGQFIDVDEGNKLKRLVIGFGAGASRVDTQVAVYYSGQGPMTPLLEFETHSDSGKLPGGAVTMAAGAVVTGGVTVVAVAATAAVAGVKAHHSAVEKLGAKGAEQATAYLSEYFGKQEWIAQDHVKKAKQ